MAVIFKHPGLPDYFGKTPRMGPTTPIQSLPPMAQAYELGRVLCFRQFRVETDHDFWAGLPTAAYPALKAFTTSPGADDPARDPMLDDVLAGAGIPADLERRLRGQIALICHQVLPLYERLFAGYRFTRRRVSWRLDTVCERELSLDNGTVSADDYVARLFVNLDSQPRIWMPGFTLDQMFQRFGKVIGPKMLAKGAPAQVRETLSRIAFEAVARPKRERYARHVVYSDPGEVWAFDTAQIASQVFYGRRAACFEFVADATSMRKVKRHPLVMAQQWRQDLLQARAEAAATAVADVA